jgi:hypothetical protein
MYNTIAAKEPQAVARANLAEKDYHPVWRTHYMIMNELFPV